MFNRLRITVIGAAYAFGLTPLFTYYTADHSKLLLASVLVIMLAHFLIAIGTIRTTLDVASGKRKNSDPSPHVTSPTIRLWKQAIKRAWPWHAALIIPKKGLSLAFVQYLHMSPRNLDWLTLSLRHPAHPIQGFLNPYIYISEQNIRGTMDVYPHVQLYPQLETILLALVVIMLFSVVNQSLLVALTLFWHKRSAQVIYLKILVSHYIISLIFAAIIVFTYPILVTNKPNVSYENQYRWPKGSTYWRVIETANTSALSFTDQGVLISANIMRPIGQTSMFAIQHNTTTDTWYPDNRPFVLRQMVAAALGLGLYGLLAWGALRLAKRGEKPLP